MTCIHALGAHDDFDAVKTVLTSCDDEARGLKLQMEEALHAISAALIIGSSIPTIYMAAKVKMPTLRTFSFLLGSFFLFHGLYHLLTFLGVSLEFELYETIGEGFFEPLSWAVMVAFAIYYAKRGG